MKILALSPYAPWPAYGGGTMRVFQLLKGLAAAHQVTVPTFADTTDHGAVLAVALPQVDWQVVAGPRSRAVWQRAFDTVFHPWPDMALRNHDHAYYVRLHELCAAGGYDIVVGFSIEMIPYLGIAESYGLLTHYDAFNAEYVIQKRAALTDIRVPRRWHAALYSLLQCYKLWRYERQRLRMVDSASVVSPGDAAVVQRLAPGTPVTVVPNGVDTTEFDRALLSAAPAPVPTVVFSGTLDYRANIDAVQWYATAVHPLVQAAIPAVECVVVGRRPAPALVALAAAGVLRLTGEVADTRPLLCSGWVYVVPMRIGGGARLKVLEAMALELPIVSTSMGAEGIDGIPAGVLTYADDPEAFAAAVIAALRTPTTNPAARVFAAAHYDWRVITPRLTEALAAEVAAARAAAAP